MCRLLHLRSAGPVDCNGYADAFSRMSKHSKEYQGHGWGCAWWGEDGWQFYRSVDPIWEHRRPKIPATRVLMIHARSAFRDEGICVENNMPFNDDRWAFIFNGELHGVRIREEGRIGAEKIFNYVKRFYAGDMAAAVEKAVSIIEKRCRYIRAMNFIISDGKQSCCSSYFNENPEYFQMRAASKDGVELVCSGELDGVEGWRRIENKLVTAI